MARDYYRILGVDRRANEAEIKKAYRKLARELHPDVTGDDPRATERFKQVTVAYEVLSDPQRKRSYDTFGTKDDPPPSGGGFPDVDSVLDQLFPNRKKAPKPEAGTDSEATVRVSFREAWTGCKKVVDKSLTVTVPAGVADGTRLRLKAQGEKGTAGGPSGDLYVLVRVDDDPVFVRDGADVLVDVKAKLTVFLFGGVVDVPLPEGSARLTLPPATQSGQVFRLRGQGLRARFRGGRFARQRCTRSFRPSTTRTPTTCDASWADAQMSSVGMIFGS